MKQVETSRYIEIFRLYADRDPYERGSEKLERLVGMLSGCEVNNLSGLQKIVLNPSQKNVRQVKGSKTGNLN